METIKQASYNSTAAKYAPIILRLGLALVFLWFGTNQIMDPISWVGFIPHSIISTTGLSATTLVFYNALFEIVAGTMLLLGFFTRAIAFILFLHLLDIAFTVGLDSLGIRDLGLAVATFVIFLNGMDASTLDRYIRA